MVPLPAAGEHVARPDHLARIDPVFGGEGKQQPLVAGDVIEHAGEKLRLARRIADGFGADSGHRQEAAEPLGLGGDEAERRDRERFGRFAAAACGRISWAPDWPLGATSQSPRTTASAVRARSSRKLLLAPLDQGRLGAFR